MRIITLRNVLVGALLAGAPVVAHAQPDYNGTADYDDAVVDVNASIGGESIASVDVFYDQLSSYGMWLDDPDLGRVFAPANGDFVPYTDGHWEDTDVGFVWVSDQPFEWATAHYGRWAFSQTYGRWCWLPDTTWGPAWVEWREADDDFGWAPLAPEGVMVAGYEPPVEAWHYAPARHIFDHDVRRYYEPRARVVEIHAQARPIVRYAQVGGARVVAGPPPEVLRQHKVDARPQKVDMRAAGRMSRPQVQAAVKHAQDNRAADEQKNRARVERDPMLQKVQAKPATAPASGPQKQPARPVERTQPAQPAPAPAQKAPTTRAPQQRAPQPPRAEPVPPAPREPQTRAPQQREPQPPRTEPTAPARPEPQQRAPQPAREPSPTQVKEQRNPPARPAPQQRAPRPQPQPAREPSPPPQKPQRAPQPAREPAPPQVKEQRTPPARPAPQPRVPSPQPAPQAQPQNPPTRPNPATRHDQQPPQHKRNDQTGG